MYDAEFAQARLFSKSLGIVLQPWNAFPERVYATDKQLIAFAGRAWLEDYPAEQFALCPIRVCLALHHTVAALLSCRVEFTVGHVVDRGTPLFTFNENDLKTWMLRRDPRKIRLHAWLTLDSLEIVDLTLDYAKQLLSAHDDTFREFTFAKSDCLPHRSYHPIAVDPKIIRLIGAAHVTLSPNHEQP